MAYLALLRTLPSVGMSQDEVDVLLDRLPKFGRICISYICACAFVKIAHKITENLGSGFIPRKGRYVVIVDLRRGQVFWTEMKLPPEGRKVQCASVLISDR
jgi:hypothetical protein